MWFEFLRWPAHGEKKMSFKVETVKWSWAEAVQSKNVYRDDEFVRSKTKEEALAAIEFLMTKPQGLMYTITVFRDGEYFTYWRHSMPCLGGLVKYHDSHGPRYFMNPYFPRDIRVAFPDGDIVFIALYRVNTKDLFKSSEYNEFVFSQESPWVSCFGTREAVIFKDNHFVLTDMNTDPTVFYSLMRLGGMQHGGAYGGAAAGKKVNPKAQILGTKTTMADPRRLAGQAPVRISGGTWAEGFGYTRPYNESIFKTSLPHKMSEFGTMPVKSYPQAPYTNDYFVAEMKSVFGIDVAKTGIPLTAMTEKIEGALVEAWDYFKEKAKELPDHADQAKFARTIKLPEPEPEVTRAAA